MGPEDVARRMFDAFASGDLARIQSLISPEVVVHMPGGDPLGGDFTGLGAVMALAARAASYLDPGSLRVLGIDVNEGEIVARLEVAGGRLAASPETVRLAQRMRFDAGRGVITESWVEPEDPEIWHRVVGGPA